MGQHGSVVAASPPTRLEPALLYLDDDLAALDKPAGMFVHRTSFGADRDVLLQRARAMTGGRVFPVHRLDRPTSGVVLFARSSEVAARLADRWPSVEKTYLALARGLLDRQLVVERPLTNRQRTRQRDARTDFWPLATVALAHTLLLARPHTGRFHQIRRHLAGEAHHVLGDTGYGKGRLNQLFREKYGLHRMALHAARLRLTHPVTGLPLEVQSPIPLNLLAPLSSMEGAEDALAGFVRSGNQLQVPDVPSLPPVSEVPPP